MGHDLSMNSRVHPKYKTKYQVTNWAEYDRALVRRGDITLWISEEAIEGWKPASSGNRGGQNKFSDKVVVPPRKTATRSRQRSTLPSARNRTIMSIKKIGRRRWKKESGYHRQARVENTCFRYKSIIGDRLRARHPESQEAEALIACNILNRLFKLGRPKSFAIAD
jgi:hypothetical protein